jgi:hypothetical protein
VTAYILTKAYLYTGDDVWELLFLMVILKIPILYLCIVVWWAVRAEPRPLEAAPLAARLPDPGSAPPRGFGRPPRPRRGPHGRPERGYDRSPARPARSRAA